MSRDNYNPYRIVGAKKIDVWFYEEGDMRRTHRIVYELIVLPLYGVCENSFLDSGTTPTNCSNSSSSRPISKFRCG